MCKIFLVLFLSCLYGVAIGQTYYPPYAITAQNPSAQLVFVGTDSSGNLYTDGTGSSGAPTTVSGYIPPVAMTGQNPSGVQVYLKTDANGNLYVNCQTGCNSGGGAVVINFTFNSGAAATDAAPRILAARTGTISNCYLLTTASDGSTALIINIFDNGSSIFSGGAQTVAAGTSAGTLTTLGSLGTTSITNNDKISVNITSGTSSWIFSVQCK